MDERLTSTSWLVESSQQCWDAAGPHHVAPAMLTVQEDEEEEEGNLPRPRWAGSLHTDFKVAQNCEATARRTEQVKYSNHLIGLLGFEKGTTKHRSRQILMT